MSKKNSNPPASVMLTPPAPPKLEPISREQFLKTLKCNERIEYVPGLGNIRISPPDFPRLIALKAGLVTDENGTIDEEEAKFAMILASCPDLRPEDLKALKEGNGFVISALLTVINKEAVTDVSVAKP